MELSSSLLKSFAAATNDAETTTSSVGTAYGTVIVSDGKTYVLLDGATSLTGVVYASDVKDGDRVIVTIENHTATITSNLTTPASGYTAKDTEDAIYAAYAEIDTIVANSITTEYLKANYITADEIEANYITTKMLEADYITAGEIEAKYVTTEDLYANYASIEYLESYYISTTELKASYATIDLLNVSTESVETLFVNTGLLTSATIVNGYITGELNGVTMSASDLTAGVIDAGTIEVVNLNCANLTVGTINGTQIASGTITLENLASEVTEEIEEALTQAGLAYDEATDAYTIASGKNTAYYQSTEPTGGDYSVNDIWYDTSSDYAMYYWNGSKWVAATFGMDALSSDVQANISEALESAGAAYDTATDAYTMASGKNTIYYSDTAPGDGYVLDESGDKVLDEDGEAIVDVGSLQVNDVWYDTSNGFLMYYWDGTEWVQAALGSGALDDEITSNINEALTTAGAAYDEAANAYSVASGKNTIYYSATTPSGSSYTINDIWYDVSNGFLMYYWDGSSWVKASLGSGALDDEIAADIAEALETAGAAYDEATNAYSLAAGKNTIYYSDTCPSGSDFEANDIWYDTSNGFLMYYWNGTEWISAVFGYGALTSDISTAIAEALETAGLAWDEATGAYTIAAGKTTAYYQDEMPSDDQIMDESGEIILDESGDPIYCVEDDVYTVNDIWYDTDDDNTMYHWDGTQWVQGQYGTAAISDGAITADKIVAGAIVAGKIATGAVTADTIAANAITGDKIAANTITGDNIVASTITGSLIAANTITASNIAAGTITADEIASGTITASNIKSGTITGTLIASNTITASNIAAGTITADEIASGAITASNIKSGTITGTLIASNTITASNIAAGTITADEIASGTITGDLIAADTITGNNIAAETITGDNIAATTITGGKLVAGTITATQIAAYTITSDNIRAGSIVGSSIAAETITGDNIAAGTITGDLIAAGTVSTDKLMVGSGGNLYSNYDTFEQVTDETLYYGQWNIDTDETCVTTDTAWTGSKCLKLVGTGNAYLYLGCESNNYGTVSVTSGKYYRVSAYVKCSSESTVYIRVIGHTSATAMTTTILKSFIATAGTSWTRVEGTYQASSSYPYISIRVDVYGTASGGITDTDGDYITDTSGNTIQDESGSTNTSATVTAYFDGFMIEEVDNESQTASPFKAAGSTLINGGNIITHTITATQIAASTITANEIDVTNLFAQEITATGSITGLKLYSTYIETTSGGKIGGWNIGSNSIYRQGDSNICYLSGSGSLTDNFIVVTDTDGIAYYALYQSGAFQCVSGYATTGFYVIEDDNTYIGLWQDSEGGNIALTSSTTYNRTYQCDAYNGNLRIISYAKGSSTIDGTVTISTSGGITTTGTAVFASKTQATSNGFMPVTDGGAVLGYSSYRWSTIYATNATVQTSDANEKTNIVDIDERYEQVFMKLRGVNYMWSNDDPNNAHVHDRIHCGLVAQEVEEACKEVGLDSVTFAVLCKDTLDEPTYDGRTERYGLAYNELHGLEIHMIQKNVYAIEKLSADALLVDTRLTIAESEIVELKAELAEAKETIKSLTEQLQASA
ncbi:MAG: tail fiber domain-containing protein [Lachnospiraceae bacterium]|nr:tail fiber domain-containing protein [Lachnospiraceae bacterium]